MSLFSMPCNLLKKYIAVRHCLFGILVFLCTVSLSYADTSEDAKTILLQLPNQQNNTGPDDDIASYPLDNNAAGKDPASNWFIAGGIHYSPTEAKAAEDTRKNRCKYYQDLQNTLPNASDGGYSYRNFVETELAFFCSQKGI